MKTSIRVLLLFFAGLSLAGCASKTAQVKVPPPSRVASTQDEKLLSGRDYWMLRDLNNSFDRARNQP